MKKKIYDIKTALNIIKKNKKRKFIESIDISIKINNLKINNIFKNYVKLPYSNGKKYKIAVCADKNKLETLRKMNIRYFWDNDLIKNIKNKKIYFNLLLVESHLTYKIKKFSNILGPRNLMPNIKLGTITDNIFYAIKDIKKGKIYYKKDKNGIINCSIGRIDYENYKIIKNLKYLITKIKKDLLINYKKFNFKNIFISSTMGKGLKLNINTLI